MSILSIYDVSGMVHRVANIKEYRNYVKNGCPFAGVSNVIDTIIADVADMREVVLAFDSRSFRKDLTEGYKKGRKKSPSVWMQLDLLQELLNIGKIPYQKVDNYEADDIIFSNCEYWNRPSTPVTLISIYSTDADILHNCTDEKVIFKCINSKFPDVYNKKDYELLYKGKLKYNLKTLWNILYGDSDFVERDDRGKKIPFKLECGATADDVYARACSLVDKHNLNGRQSRSVEFARALFGTFPLTDKEKDRLELAYKVFYPVLLRDLEFVTINVKMVLTKQFASFIKGFKDNILTDNYKHIVRSVGNMYQKSEILDNFNLIEENKMVRETINSYKNRYLSGVYAVDNNLSVNDVEESSATVSEFLDLM